MKEEKTLTATWKDITAAYKIDYQKFIRLAPKLTPYHINPEKKKKMKVALATQVFSHVTAAAIYTMAETSKYWDYNIL